MGSDNKLPVIFILMEFAPVNTTGNFRSLKFIKYLGNFGIQPIIVSFLPEEAAKIFNAKIDYGLLNELPPESIIYRIHCDNFKEYRFKKVKDFFEIYFSIKDSLAKRWKPYLFAEIGSIIKRHQPKLLFTSLPPFSSGMLTAEISEKYKIPFVLDMRDLWSHLGFAPLASIFHYWVNLKEERKLYKLAAAVIGVTPQMIKTFHKVQPALSPERFHYISNGFDIDLDSSEDFEYIPSKDRIVIGYTGSFYYDPERRKNTFRPWWKKRGHHMLEYNPAKMDWLYRSPFFFFKALAWLKKVNPPLVNSIRIEFIGRKPYWMDSMLKEFDLTQNFFSHGFVSYDESLRIQEGFDILLATSEKYINDEHYCLPSKIFDFVGQKKPILGFVTEGIQKEFIQKSGLGIICDPDDTESAGEAISKLLLNGRKFKANTDYLAGFHRSHLSEQLALLFHNLVDQS